MTLWLGNLNAQGKGVLAPAQERVPTAPGWNPAPQFPWGPAQAPVSQPREHFPVSSTCRFSTKSWLSQVCHVCQKSMMFGVKCKHCR